MRMIDIAGTLINPEHVVSAEVETRHYMNGSSSYLVVVLDDGRTLRREHGWGFDVWKTLDKLKE
jgi:hypothetical protein